MEITGYKDVREIHRGIRFVVFQGAQTTGGPPVVVKTLFRECRDKTSAARLQHEYELIARLRVPGVAKPISFGEIAGIPALVLEDAGPQNLKEWLGGTALEPRVFLDLAIQIAEVVARIHQSDIVHRDINPFNIVVDAKGHVTLIDFEAATSLAELARSEVPAPVEGLLAYFSPEQTGRINRLVDQRSDLYSVGATLYEMLTGAPPFPSTDPVELVHAHLAKTPVPPTQLEPAAPLVLSQIVLKLLAKMPEQRYQTAAALLADLQEAERRLAAFGTIEPFELGLLDLARELPLPDDLYGRERELTKLTAALDRAIAGPRELVLISGAAGIGKSALAESLRGPAAQRNAWFVMGKVVPQQGNAPYAPLIEAFRDLVFRLLREPEDVVASLRKRLEAALQPIGRVMTAVIPELEGLIGAQPPIPTLGHAQAENRFHWAFRSFVRTLSSAEHPLVVFLDNLQWADPASLRLIESLATDSDSYNVLFVLASRPTGPEHPLTQMLEAMRSAEALVQSVELMPLDLDAVTALCCDTLRCEPDAGRPLAALVLRKTAGNPFFLKRFLRLVHQSGLFCFDPVRGVWTWDLASIEKMPVAENVVDLLVQSLQTLPEPTQNVLKVAACIGPELTLGLLAVVQNQPLDITARATWVGIREGFLVPLEAPEGPAGPSARYQFVHDRVQQAAYSLLSDAERKAVHLELGRRLSEGIDADEMERRLFAVVDQLNLGAELITNESERLRLAELNLRAARKALASAAHGPALAYLRHGQALLPKDAWRSEHDLAFALHRDAAECAYFSGHAELAGVLFETALAHAQTPLEQAALFNLRVVVASTIHQDFADAVRWGREGLRLFGLELPEPPFTGAVAAEMVRVRANLQGRAVDELVDAPPMQEVNPRECMKLLANLLAPTYFGVQGLYPFVVAKMVNLSLAYGNAPQSALSYTAFGLFASSQLGSGEIAHAFGKLGVELSRRVGHPALQCIALGLFGAFVNSWYAPLRTSVRVLRESVAKGLEGGELPYANYWSISIVKNLFHQGVPLDRVVAENEAAIDLGRKTRIFVGAVLQTPFRQLIRCLQGRTRERNRFDDSEFDEQSYLASMAHDPYAICLYEILRLESSYLFGDLELARQMSAVAGQHLEYQRATLSVVEYNFYSSLTLAASCSESAETRELLTAIEENQRQLGIWADCAPENFRHKHMLVAAELARIKGQFLEAAALYDQAIEAAQRQHFIQDEALANELAGRFYRALGRKRIATLYLSSAVEAYERWGATEKAKALAEEFPYRELLEEPYWPPASPVSDEAGPAALDLLSILKAAETISSEVVLDSLLEKLMDVCLATAGAQRGAILVDEHGELMVRAVATVGETTSRERTPLETSRQVPITVVDHVRKSGTALVLADAAHLGSFVTDPYVAEHDLKSVLALPIRRQARLVGVLYLENNLATRVFVPERVRVLKLLSSQIAISLEISLLVEALTREVEVRDEFLAIASHELYTPVTSLQLLVQGLRTGTIPASPETLSRTFGVAERQTKKLTRLIDELLNVSRIQRSGLALKLATVDLAAVTREVTQRFEDELARAGSALVLHAEAPVRGLWDRDRLEQVVTNLVSNAAKFGAGKPIEITVAEAGGTARLIVTDHGIGIAPGRLSRIFDRFERAVSPRQYGGLGLGLYIVREIAQALGGSVRVESQVGLGSTFTLELPCEGPAGGRRDGQRDAQRGALSDAQRGALSDAQRGALSDAQRGGQRA